MKGNNAPRAPRNNAQISAARRIQKATGASYPQALRFAAYQQTKVRLGVDENGSAVTITVGSAYGYNHPVAVAGRPDSGKTALLRGIASDLVAAGWRNVVVLGGSGFGELKGVKQIESAASREYVDALVRSRIALSNSHDRVFGLDDPQGWLLAEPVMLLVDDRIDGLVNVQRYLRYMRSLGLRVIAAAEGTSRDLSFMAEQLFRTGPWRGMANTPVDAELWRSFITSYVQLAKVAEGYRGRVMVIDQVTGDLRTQMFSNPQSLRSGEDGRAVKVEAISDSDPQPDAAGEGASTATLDCQSD